ncbi:MAG: hypothetical protein M3350_02625, partial [Actinomycetota bacterium]|nr:hypothetical protein [Actinomycetota bacterium]
MNFSIPKRIAWGVLALATLAVSALFGPSVAFGPPRQLPRAELPAPRPSTVQDVLVRFRSGADAGERTDARDAARTDFEET